MYTELMQILRLLSRLIGTSLNLLFVFHLSYSGPASEAGRFGSMLTVVVAGMVA